MRFKWFSAAFLAFAAIPSAAQKPVVSSAEMHASAEHIPTIKLAFVEEKDTPQVGGPEIAFGPIGCSPDGAVFLAPWQPSAPPTTGLLSVARVNDAYSVTTFAMDQISDVHDAHLRDYYATESLVALLLTDGTRDNAMSTSKRLTVVPRTGERYKQSDKSGTRPDYIATFDRQGKYKEAVELDLPFKPRRIAAFNSALYLVIGSDTEQKPRFAFVGPDGSLQRLLDTEKPMLGWEGMIEATGLSHVGSTQFLAGAPPQFGRAQIVSFHDKLLFVWPGMTWILEIGPSGLVRRVPIRVPEGFVVDHFVPSEKMWYVSFRKYGADSNADMETTLYEINPLDGMPTRRFDTAPEYVAGIACERDGEFRAIAFDLKGLRMFRATTQN